METKSKSATHRYAELRTVDDDEEGKNRYNQYADARHEFNVHFFTFWHLTYLATVNTSTSESVSISKNWKMMNDLGRKWKGELSANDFEKFNTKLTKALVQMDHTADVPKLRLEEEAVRILQNYDKCVNIVRSSTKFKHDEVQSATVCGEMLDFCCRDIADFKLLPLAWNYLFVSQTYQLIQLARNCYSEDSGGEWFDRLLTRHASFASDLGQHFSQPIISLPNSTSSTSLIDLTSLTSLTSSSKAVNLKLTAPTISLGTLVTTLGENAKCAAEQVPTAVTSIMHEYCHLDPFYFGDFEFVKMNVANVAVADK